MSDLKAQLAEMRGLVAKMPHNGNQRLDERMTGAHHPETCWRCKLEQLLSELPASGQPRFSDADCLHECPITEPESRLDEFKTTVIALYDPDLTNDEKRVYIASRSKELRELCAARSPQPPESIAKRTCWLEDRLACPYKLIGTRKPTPAEEAYGLTLEPLAQHMLFTGQSTAREAFEKWWTDWLETQTDDFNPKHSAFAAWQAALACGGTGKGSGE